MIAAGWTVSLLSAYFVENFIGLIIIRVVLGFFEGGTYGLCVVHIAKWFSNETRGSAYAIMTSGTTFGTYLAAPILILLIGSVGWQHTFAALGLISLVWAVVFYFFRSQPKEPIQETLSTLPSTQDDQFKDIIKIMLNPYVLSVMAVGFVSMWVNTWVLTWAPTYLTKIVGFNTQVMSVVFAGMGVAGTIFAIFVGKYTDVLFLKNKSLIKSYDRVLTLVLITGAVAYGVTTVVETPILWVISLSIGLIMNTCLLPLGTTIKTLIVPKNIIGSISGISLSITSMAGIIGPYITGHLITLAGLGRINDCSVVHYQCSNLIIDTQTQDDFHEKQESDYTCSCRISGINFYKNNILLKKLIEDDSIHFQ
ncbi:MFS transporter [Neobacillus cucumis]|uniref:MFS transporter n=1 Tax=Neobacillus cucumis TaxID=1740721 RepID=UPI002E1EA561|nr:MFS transporter [Neobacillus cucumis]MED4225539.1 MFS transporter [Neobacillus cucumis]